MGLKNLSFKNYNIQRSFLLKGKVFFILLLFSQSVTSYSQSPFTLSQCIDYALVNNPSIASAKLDEEIAGKDSWIIASSGFPQINGFGSLDDNIKIPVSAVPARLFDPEAPEGAVIPLQFGTQYNAIGYIQLDQLIYKGSYLVALKAAKVSRVYYGLALQQVVENTIYEVSRAYFQALVAKKQAEVQKANIKNTQELLDIVELQFKNDFIIKADRDRVLVDYNNQLSDLRSLERVYTQALNLLQFRMGMPVKDEIAIVDFLDKETLVIVPEIEENVNYSRRADYRALRTQVELQELQVKQFKAEYQPTLSGYGRYQYQAFRREFNFFDTDKEWFNSQVIGLRLNAPIFNGFQKRFQVQRAKLVLSKSLVNLKTYEQQINLELSNAYSEYLTTIENLKLAKSNVSLAEEVYRTQKLLYEQEVGTYADFLNSRNALNASRLNYTNSLLNFYSAKVDLAKAKGTLNEVVEWKESGK